MKILKNPDGTESRYNIREDNKVYFMDHLLPNADAKTFEVLLGKFGKDKNHIYCKSRALKDFIDIDYDNFKIFNNHYAGDDKILLYNGEYIVNHNVNIKDVKAFIQEPLEESYLKYYDVDSPVGERGFRVSYWNLPFIELQKLIEEEIFTRASMMIKHKHHLYLYIHLLENIDSNSAQIIYALNNIIIIKDKNAIWLYNDWNNKTVKITDDIDHFKIISHEYYYDSNSFYKFYLNNKKLIQIIKKSFNINYLKIKKWDIICYDKCVYDSKGKLIEDADGQSFDPIDNFWGADKNHVFDLTTKNILLEADPLTFEATGNWQHIRNDDYTKDENHVFYKGQLVNEIDASSFKILDNGEVRDKNKAYTEKEMEKWYKKKILALKK